MALNNNYTYNAAKYAAFGGRNKVEEFVAVLETPGAMLKETTKTASGTASRAATQKGSLWPHAAAKGPFVPTEMGSALHYAFFHDHELKARMVAAGIDEATLNKCNKFMRDDIGAVKESKKASKKADAAKFGCEKLKPGKSELCSVCNRATLDVYTFHTNTFRKTFCSTGACQDKMKALFQRYEEKGLVGSAHQEDDELEVNTVHDEKPAASVVSRTP